MYNHYISAGPSIEGPPGCGGFASILHPVSYVSLHPGIYILLFLYPVMQVVSCILYPVSCILLLDPVSCILYSQLDGVLWWVWPPDRPDYHHLGSLLETWLDSQPSQMLPCLPGASRCLPGTSNTPQGHHNAPQKEYSWDSETYIGFLRKKKGPCGHAKTKS